MITESHLWAKFKAAVDCTFSCNRIETGLTALGVSDVYYTCGIADGWIELKISHSSLDLPFRFQHPLSIEQARWLLEHWRPEIKLFSWILIGLATGNRWDGCTLVPGYMAIHLFQAQQQQNSLRDIAKLDRGRHRGWLSKIRTLEAAADQLITI